MPVQYREDYDTLGAVKVPADSLWSAQTQRSIENFPFERTERQPPEIIRAMAIVKQACAKVNKKNHRLAADKADAIIAAAVAIQQATDHTDKTTSSRTPDTASSPSALSTTVSIEDFPLVIWQTGSGTQTNMNMNEVIANMASLSLGGKLGDKEWRVHPNDDVNKGQSSNDTFPSAMTIAVTLNVKKKLLPSLTELIGELTDKVKEFENVIKLGRTHMMDAVPMTLGQEFSAYKAALEMCQSHIASVIPLISTLALGGTAVGTGLNSFKGFAEDVAEEISKITGVSFGSNPNKFLALSQVTPMVCLSGAITALATALMKMANDVRLLASGPRCGLGDIIIPANEPGSSIMPGKVNPTQVESLAMVCSHVIGANQTVVMSNTYGHLNLNVFLPVTAATLLRNINLLSTAMNNFKCRCLNGLEPNSARLQEHLTKSLMLVTSLTPHIGYYNASTIAKYAHTNSLTLKEAAVALNLLTETEFDQYCQPKDMLQPSAS